MNLKDKVDQAMPGWERWYPSLFDAAVDLGILRARVCAPSSLLLSNRHAQVRDEAEAMHRDRWGGDFSNEDGPPSLEASREQLRRPGRKKKPRRKARRQDAAPVQTAKGDAGDGEPAVRVTPRQPRGSRR